MEVYQGLRYKHRCEIFPQLSHKAGQGGGKSVSCSVVFTIYMGRYNLDLLRYLQEIMVGLTKSLRGCRGAVRP